MSGYERVNSRLKALLPDRVSVHGDPWYLPYNLTWARSESRPAAIVHCAEPRDAQIAVLCALEADVPLSVCGGGHDWAGRALCDGVVLDLSAMRGVSITSDGRSARVGGGARGIDLFPLTDPNGLAPVTGSAGMVGLAGLTLGGGYGPLSGRFGLACDNLLAADVILPDGRLVTASNSMDHNLMWALRGGGGNFGVVVSMTLALHQVSSVRSGLALYSLEQAQSVIEAVSEIAAAADDALDIQMALMPGPYGGAAVLAVIPTWSGPLNQAEAQIAPLLSLGALMYSDIRTSPYGESRRIFDAHVVPGRRTAMTARWVSTLEKEAISVLIEQVRRRPSPLCSVITHNFHGAAARVKPHSTAFGLREPHVMLELLAQISVEDGNGAAERAWVEETAAALDPFCLPGGYPNLLGPDEAARSCDGFGNNLDRLILVKRTYDPNNLFRSALSLPSTDVPTSSVVTL